MKNPALVLWIFFATALFADKNADLLYFAAAGKIETVKALLDAKANINVKDDYGWTPLMHAVKYGRVETVRLLLAAKANPSVCFEGISAIDLAMFGAYDEIFQLLLAAKPNVNTGRADVGERPLTRAIRLDKAHYVRALIAAGAQVNYISDFGYKTTALHDAARMGNREIVTAIIEAKAKVNIRNAAGETPMQTATDAEIKRLIAAAGGTE